MIKYMVDEENYPSSVREIAHEFYEDLSRDERVLECLIENDELPIAFEMIVRHGASEEIQEKYSSTVWPAIHFYHCASDLDNLIEMDAPDVVKMVKPLIFMLDIRDSQSTSDPSLKAIQAICGDAFDDYLKVIVAHRGVQTRDRLLEKLLQPQSVDTEPRVAIALEIIAQYGGSEHIKDQFNKVPGVLAAFELFDCTTQMNRLLQGREVDSTAVTESLEKLLKMQELSSDHPKPLRRLAKDRYDFYTAALKEQAAKPLKKSYRPK